MRENLAYLKKRRSALKFLIRTPKRKFTKDRFHLLRVELKKLKAILLRMEFLLPDFDRKKFYKPFRKLFAQAGKVREIQIEKEILRSYGILEQIPEYVHLLNKKIQKERVRFFKVRTLALNSKIEKRLMVLRRNVRKVSQIDSGPFLANLIGEIKSLLATGILEEQSAHLLRKKLKSLKYNLESLQDEKMVNRHPEQEELVNLLGTWHDLVTVQRTLLSDIFELPVKEEEKESLQRLAGTIQSDSERIFKEINQKIPLFDDFILPPKLKSSQD